VGVGPICDYLATGVAVILLGTVYFRSRPPSTGMGLRTQTVAGTLSIGDPNYRIPAIG